MIESLVVDVEHAVAHGDILRRGTMLRRMTGLFADSARGLADEHLATFDIVLLKLAQNVEGCERVILSEGIADIPNAPAGIVRDLAYDADVAVAGPVLSRSSRLAEADVVAVAQARGQEHLHCIARRLTLSERVTDVLMIRGNRRVVGTMAANDGARFSEQGFATLTRKAQDDGALRDVLGARRDLPAHHGVRVANGRPDESLSGPGPRPASPESLAECDVDEKRVVALISEGRIPEALAALARIAQVPAAMVVEAHEASDHDAMLFLLRAIRFGWGTLKLLIQARSGKALSPEEMRGAFEAFQALSVTTAQRVVRFKVSSHDASPRRGAA